MDSAETICRVNWVISGAKISRIRAADKRREDVVSCILFQVTPAVECLPWSRFAHDCSLV